jgi:CheY-like chemotaxis protein
MPLDESLAPDSLAGVCVLIVAEAPAARRTLATIVGAGGALVLSAASATEALWLLGWVQPTIIVVDVPPDAGGVRSLLPLMRALKPEAGAVLPAVAVAEAADPAVLRGTGFDAVIARPLDPRELCRLVFTLTSGDR